MSVKVLTLTGLSSVVDKLKEYMSANFLGKSSNAVSATKLYTARKIDGVSFNGTANISTFYKGTSAPSNTACLWINTSNNTLNYYNGSSWVAIRGVYA